MQLLKNELNILQKKQRKGCIGAYCILISNQFVLYNGMNHDNKNAAIVKTEDLW